MHTLVFDRHDIDLEYENNCLIIREDKGLPRTLPLTYIRKILCLHSVRLSTSLLGQLWQRGIDFIVINGRYSERCLGLYANQQTQVERRCTQYSWQQDQSQCLALAIELCQHRLQLCRRLDSVRQDHNLTLRLQHIHTSMPFSNHLDELRGAEGAAQRLLFEHWRKQLPASLGFEKRQRQPPPDPVNALLSLTYTLVMQEAIRQCSAAGLDSQLGFYHRTAGGRHSLACDLMEPVRPAIEQWVMQRFINGLLDQRHFTHQTRNNNKGCMLGKRGREIFYQAVDPCLSVWQRQLQAIARWTARKIDQQRQLQNDQKRKNP